MPIIIKVRHAFNFEIKMTKWDTIWEELNRLTLLVAEAFNTTIYIGKCQHTNKTLIWTHIILSSWYIRKGRVETERLQTIVNKITKYKDEILRTIKKIEIKINENPNRIRTRNLRIRKPDTNHWTNGDITIYSVPFCLLTLSLNHEQPIITISIALESMYGLPKWLERNYWSSLYIHWLTVLIALNSKKWLICWAI